MKKEENEELQSRRDFFKNAAKKVLPIIGTVLLANIPNFANADDTEMGCDWGCSSGCKGGCGRVCSYGCTNSCAGSCDGACKGYCQGSCKGSCSFSSSY